MTGLWDVQNLSAEGLAIRHEVAVDRRSGVRVRDAVGDEDGAEPTVIV